MRVKSVLFHETDKVFRLDDGRRLQAHRHCCLGPGDEVRIRKNGVMLAVCSNGEAQILPIYSSSGAVSVGGRRLKLTVKEIETSEELESYHQLEKFHYRGKVLHGRRVPLILRSHDPLLPPVLGYIELSTAFIMNRPRAEILDGGFSDSQSDISWENWRKDASRQYTNLIVRIARTVVSPEFRGLGLSRLLVENSVRFARKHWHVGRLKPLFLEITADMLRYAPFVESAGMHYIGETEGNLKRINKDMEYVLRNLKRVKNREILREESGGIVDLQVFYATALARIQRKHRLSREQLLKLLLRSPHRLSDEHWALLHRILRLPKPTFLMGLSQRADRFVRERARVLGIPARLPQRHSDARPASMTRPISVVSCSFAIKAPLIRTRATRRIQEAFGVNHEMLTTNVFSELSFSIDPGEVVLICGPSGAGKTTLLSVLTQQLRNKRHTMGELRGKIELARNTSITVLETLTSSRPVVSALGARTLDDALYALNVSGLAEAHLYVRRFRELSNGQRYRAMVAKLIASRSSIWVADEYCATLDAITANIVSRNLRRCAKQLGSTVILAAANWAEFVHELRPDKVIHLRSPWEHKVYEWPEFRRAARISRATTLNGFQVL